MVNDVSKPAPLVRLGSFSHMDMLMKVCNLQLTLHLATSKHCDNSRKKMRSGPKLVETLYQICD